MSSIKFFLEVPAMRDASGTSVKWVNINPNNISRVDDVLVPTEVQGPDGQNINKILVGIFQVGFEPLLVNKPKNMVLEVIENHMTRWSGEKCEGVSTFRELDE